MRERPPGPPDPPIIPGHMGWPGREKLDALVEEAVSAFCDRTKVPIEERLVQAARDTAGAVSALLGEAYSQGVRDGFVQGIAAAMDEHSDPLNQDERQEAGDE